MDRLGTPLRPDFATVFAAYLDPGEHLLWTGQPRQGIYLRPSDAIAIPFSLIWGGFALAWESVALFGMGHSRGGSRHAPLLFELWGLPFVLVGLYLMIGRFFLDAAARRATWYALTNRRALIVTGKRTRRLVSYALQLSQEVDLTSFADGSGTIAFAGANRSLATARNSTTNSFGTTAAFNFERIPQAEQVYHLVREVQNGQH